MNVTSYYDYQAIARGQHSVNHVLEDMERVRRTYDQVIRPWLPESKDAAIHEVACGAGVFLHWLRSVGFNNTTGSDSSEVQIALAKQGGLNVVLLDAIQDLKQREIHTLDAIVALDFYEHLPKEIYLEFVAEAYRVLRPGGGLIMKGPNGDSPLVGRALYNDITHHWAITSTAFRATSAMLGFTYFDFKDDTIASIQKNRWAKVPLALMSRFFLQLLVRLATREDVKYWSASFFMLAKK